MNRRQRRAATTRLVCPLCGDLGVASTTSGCDVCGADADDVDRAEPAWWEDRQ